MRVVLRSVMMLPQFWLEPEANRLDDTAFFVATGAAGAALCVVVAFNATGAGAAGLAAGSLLPKEIWDLPPGGACTRVELRPVMTLPQFWLAPLA